MPEGADRRQPRGRHRGQRDDSKRGGLGRTAEQRGGLAGTAETGEGVVAGRRPVIEMLKGSRPMNRILIADNVKRSGVVAEIRGLAAAASIPVAVVARTEIDRLAPESNHQGVVAETARYRYSSFSDLVSAAAPAVLFLDGVTDPQNLGSLLRSAEGAGIDGVVVPVHRSAGVTAAVRRVSVGASEFVPTARVSSLPSALDHARSAGLWIVGLDGDAEDVLWDSQLFDRPVGLVLGSEERGLSSTVRGKCDGLVRIPQFGRLGSLNVAVAGALAMYEVARRDSATLRS